MREWLDSAPISLVTPPDHRYGKRKTHFGWARVFISATISLSNHCFFSRGGKTRPRTTPESIQPQLTNAECRPSEYRETRGGGTTKVNCDLMPKNIRTKQKYTLTKDARVSDFISRPGRFYGLPKLSASRRKDILHVIQHANEGTKERGVQRCGRKWR